MKGLLVLLSFVAFGAVGCAGARKVGYAVTSTLAGEGAPEATATAPANSKLMIFGGQDHAVYLGCLSCSEYSSESIYDKYGSYGSQYSSTSIFNQYSPYGSAYSAYGACNKYATDPPVIVDSSGKYYGRLTMNRNVAGFGIGAQYIGWLSGVCQH